MKQSWNENYSSPYNDVNNEAIKPKIRRQRGSAQSI